MRKKIAAISAMAVLAGPVYAGNPDAGRAKAVICAGCHGQNGISAIPNYPNLKGQKEQYIIKSLRAFRDGQRTDPAMSPMARPLSDTDIEDLAAYFSDL